MAYVYDPGYNGDIYRGGATGVGADFGLRDYFAQMEAQDYAANGGRPTQDQIGQSRQDLAGAYGGYQNLYNNGMYSPQEQSQILSGRVQQINATTQAMQQNLNNQIAQRGLSKNAGAAAAMGMQGQFAAAGQRGQAYGDIMEQQAQSRIAGLGGMAGIAGQMAQYAAMPTAKDNRQTYADMYDQWRNAKIGYNGAKWGSAPQQPDYYGTPQYTPGSTSGGNTSNGSNSYGVSFKRYNYAG